ncbi:MAG: glucose 1-dehydrogenase [Armatimonadetes bacterium]|nr:glucose 1-dehydrogenase [Armatimonadota bacterium]
MLRPYLHQGRFMIDLSGKHIFIAGGSRGIGAASARMAASAGALVSINYARRADRAESLAAEITAAGGQAFAVQADVAEDGAMDRAMDAATERLGPLWGLVVSAGIFEGAWLQDMSTEFWDRTMAINVRGTFLAVRAAARHLRQAGRGGSIVIYTSTAGQRGSAEYSAYATSKGAQILFMRSMAKELAPDRIRVNCIAPAWTETEMAAPSLDALGREDVAKGFPLGRIGLPEDVAGATCFLLSDLAAFITGSTVTVDGGMDMRG